MMAAHLRISMRFYFPLLIISVLFWGCSKQSPERHYKEVVIQAPASNAPFMGEDPHARLGLDIPIIKQHTREDNALVWEVPDGWREEPAAGMRLATFKLADNPDEIDVSIVSLGGMAGGIQANLERWAKQIDLNIDPSQFDSFVNAAPKIKTQSGTDAVLFDFTKLQSGSTPSAKSTIAAMIEMEDTTVFVKMTGTIEAVRKNQAAFEQLTRSVHKK
jgi:hypothetical protein